jgi:hypothetical protein
LPSFCAHTGDRRTASNRGGACDADVLLSAAFTAFGEQLLTGQQKPESFGQAWHINPLEEKVDSALALTLREDDFAAGLVRMRPQDAKYDSLRTKFAEFRAFVASHPDWGITCRRANSKPRDTDSPTRPQHSRAASRRRVLA